MVRFLTRAAFIVALLLTLLVGAVVIEGRSGDAEWRAYADAARARGTKLALSEYVPPPVPDERNFAAIPLFQNAFQKPKPPNPLAWPPAKGTKPPTTGAVFKNEWLDLKAWQKSFVDLGMLSAPGTDPAADVLQAIDRRYAPQLQQLHEADHRPESRFPIDYDAGFSALLPHMEILQSASRLDALRIAAHLARGDSPAAYDDLRDGLRLYSALDKEPTLISSLVRLAILSVQENAIANGLRQRQWGDAELARIEADLSHIRVLDDYVLGLRGERGFSNTLYDQLTRDPSGKMAGVIEASGAADSPWVARLRYLCPGGWLRRSQIRSNRFLDEMLARVSQDPPRVFPERSVPSLPEEPPNAFEHYHYLLFYTFAPVLRNVERNFAYGQTLLDQTRLGCALERYRLAHGSFPPSLDPLVPAFLPSLPRDVMNGEPLHYRLEPDGGYTLYSVAWNLHDDDGKSDPKAPAKDQPDWVWTMPGK